VNGTGVLISPAKERGEAIQCRQRQFSTRSTSQSDLQTTHRVTSGGFAKASKTNTIQQSTNVGAMLGL
jgi:NAD-specific glutamate dehydrogenase